MKKEEKEEGHKDFDGKARPREHHDCLTADTVRRERRQHVEDHHQRSLPFTLKRKLDVEYKKLHETIKMLALHTYSGTLSTLFVDLVGSTAVLVR